MSSLILNALSWVFFIAGLICGVMSQVEYQEAMRGESDFIKPCRKAIGGGSFLVIAYFLKWFAWVAY